MQQTIEGTHPRCHWPFDEDINADLHVRWNHRSAHKPPIPTKWDTPRHILYYSTVTAHTHICAGPKTSSCLQSDVDPWAEFCCSVSWVGFWNLQPRDRVSNDKNQYYTHIYIYVAACMLTNCSCLEYGWANIYIYIYIYNIYMVFLSI